MIIIYHQDNKVVEIDGGREAIDFLNKSIADTLFEIAKKNSESYVVWCILDLKPNLNLSAIVDVVHHRKIMASYNLSKKIFLPESIGYVEGTPFININKQVTYPTWQMSTDVGCIHASVLLSLKNLIKVDQNFDYFLCSLAKLAMPNGLLCYSEPKLLKEPSVEIKKQKNDDFVLFRFVKQHYRIQWVFLLFLNLLLYERKIALLPLLYSFFFSRRKLNPDIFDNIKVQSTKNIKSGTIDVIIPTIGRKKYLYDVLKDLSKQTYLPQKVIIVEQNPAVNSVSELDYIDNESWPFVIEHIFTHQPGACNARNLALSKVTSEWVFLNDDDNRFEANLIEDTLQNCSKYGSIVANSSYLKEHEIKNASNVYQVPFFGSGNSFIASTLLEKVSFRMGFEFGYGEDSDFGMQLRNLGADVLFFPNPEIIHLSAPIGGFRTKPVLAWSKDVVQPKPSPTIMLYKQLHSTKEQINGYKTILFFKFYKVQTIKNPFLYFNNFKKQWTKSLYWANELKNIK